MIDLVNRGSFVDGPIGQIGQKSVVALCLALDGLFSELARHNIDKMSSNDETALRFEETAKRVIEAIILWLPSESVDKIRAIEKDGSFLWRMFVTVNLQKSGKVKNSRKEFFTFLTAFYKRM